jgi:hypothetical protein
MHKSSTITLMFCVGTILLAPAYWFIAALMSWGGPGDDINIIYILFLPVLLHGMIIEKYGFKRTAVNSLVYLILIAILCIARHIELSGSTGYSERQAGRSLESLAWTLPWFSIGVIASIFSKSEATIEEAEQDVHGNTH